MPGRAICCSRIDENLRTLDVKNPIKHLIYPCFQACREAEIVYCNADHYDVGIEDFSKKSIRLLEYCSLFLSKRIYR